MSQQPSSTVDAAQSPHVAPQDRGRPRDRRGALADVRVRREPETGCVIWLGPVDKDGYPVTRVDGRTVRPAREIWAMHYRQQQHLGWVHVWTLCGNRRCVAPMHHAPGPLRRVLRHTRTHKRAADEVRRAIIRRAQPGGAGGFWWDRPGLQCDARSSAEVASAFGVDGLVPLTTYGSLALRYRTTDVLITTSRQRG